MKEKKSLKRMFAYYPLYTLLILDEIFEKHAYSFHKCERGLLWCECLYSPQIHMLKT